MKLLDLLNIVLRWRLLVITIVIIAVASVGLRAMLTRPTYEANVKLQITAPQEEDVFLFNQYRSDSSADAIMIARNNFASVLNSPEVFQRTVEQLGLKGSQADYSVEYQTTRDSEFMYVTVQAETADLAVSIAQAHVQAAIGYFGEIRAKPTTAVKDNLEKKMQTAEENVRKAEQAFADFRIKNQLSTFDREIAGLQEIINALQKQRDQLIVDRPTNRLIERVDALLVERQRELDTLITMETTYNKLTEDVDQARSEHKLLQDKYTEATLKEETVKNVTYIQFAEQISTPTRPISSNFAALLVLTLVASLCAGILLALVLEYLSKMRLPAPPKIETSDDPATPADLRSLKA